MLKVHFSDTPEKGFSALNAQANENGFRRSSAPLGEWVALLAMKYRRAPLPVSRGREKALMSQGLAEGASELGDLARRYLFLGDAGILLAESRKRPTLIANSLELELVNQLSMERQTQPETGVHYQCP